MCRGVIEKIGEFCSGISEPPDHPGGIALI